MQTNEVSFSCSLEDVSLSEAVTTGENLETKSALDLNFLATIGRKDELLTPIVVALWFFRKKGVGRLGKSSAILLFF
jgi:hypothetical protein